MNEAFFTPKEDLTGKWNIRENPKLPRVLVLGDSISIGYTPFVREQLEGIANVIRPLSGARPVNCGSTAFGIQQVSDWVSGGSWNVIHFNWGLHDIAYRHPDSKVQGNRDKINGTLAVEPENYYSNLLKIVDILKNTGAKLIWASTTLVPPEEAGRFEGDEVKYNRLAEEIMRKEQVIIHDLHEVSKQQCRDLFIGPGDVHFTKEGYRILGESAASMIRELL